VKYAAPVPSADLVARIREEESVLVVSGSSVGMEGYLRIGFGCDPEFLIGALDRLGTVIDTLASSPDTYRTAPG